jgi:hypothetical protein
MVIFIILNLISIILCYYVAKYRKAKINFWVLAALVVGPFAIPFVFFSKPEANSE